MPTVADILRIAADEYLWDGVRTYRKKTYLCHAIADALEDAGSRLLSIYERDNHPAVLWLKECGTYMGGSGFTTVLSAEDTSIYLKTSVLPEMYQSMPMGDRLPKFDRHEAQQLRYCWAHFCADLWEEEHARKP